MNLTIWEGAAQVARHVVLVTAAGALAGGVVARAVQRSRSTGLFFGFVFSVICVIVASAVDYLLPQAENPLLATILLVFGVASSVFLTIKVLEKMGCPLTIWQACELWGRIVFVGAPMVIAIDDLIPHCINTTSFAGT